MDDYLLPDDDSIAKMNKEYLLSGVKNASIFACDNVLATCERDYARTHFYLILVFGLYITNYLRYNAKYGTEIYDPNGSLGGIRPIKSTFGIVNNLK